MVARKNVTTTNDWNKIIRLYTPIRSRIMVAVKAVVKGNYSDVVFLELAADVLNFYSHDWAYQFSLSPTLTSKMGYLYVLLKSASDKGKQPQDYLDLASKCKQLADSVLNYMVSLRDKKQTFIGMMVSLYQDIRNVDRNMVLDEDIPSHVQEWARMLSAYKVSSFSSNSPVLMDWINLRQGVKNLTKTKQVDQMRMMIRTILPNAKRIVDMLK